MASRSSGSSGATPYHVEGTMTFLESETVARNGVDMSIPPGGSSDATISDEGEISYQAPWHDDLAALGFEGESGGELGMLASTNVGEVRRVAEVVLCSMWLVGLELLEAGVAEVDWTVFVDDASSIRGEVGMDEGPSLGPCLRR